MLKVDYLKADGFEAALRGMRNPLNSWDKSDSCFEPTSFSIGENDIKLCQRLIKAGTEHAKFLRMINVSLDITAPLYWWKEYSTYKIGTVANSCSTMHKIAAKEFTRDDFSCEHLIANYDLDSWYFKEDDIELCLSPLSGLDIIIGLLNVNRKVFLETKDKKYWWQMIQLLPSS